MFGKHNAFLKKYNQGEGAKKTEIGLDCLRFELVPATVIGLRQAQRQESAAV